MTDKPLTDDRGFHSLDPKHAPVALPPGSFDVEKLGDALETVAKAKPAERDGAISDALSKTDESGLVKGDDRALMPGYKRVETAHPELEGVTENAIVFDEKLDKKEEERREEEQTERREASEAAAAETGSADQAQASRAGGSRPAPAAARKE